MGTPNRKKLAKHVSAEPGRESDAGATMRIPPVWVTAAFIIVIGCVFALYAPSLKHGFVDWDDPDNFIRNPDYRGLSWDNIRWMFSTVHMGHYQPLTWLSCAFDTVWGGWVWGPRSLSEPPDPRPQHFTNNLLHAVNSGLVLLAALGLIRRTVADRQADDSLPENAAQTTRLPVMTLIGAFVAASFFGVHPLRVESVSWATERRDLLSGFFLLLSVLAYLRAVRPGGQGYRLWMAVTLGLFVFSLLSKVIGVTLPAVLLILDWYPLRRLRGSPGTWLQKPTLNVLLEKIPFFTLSLVFSLIASISQGKNQWLVTLEMHGWGARIVQSIYGLMFYVWKTILPLDLLPLYQIEYPMNVKEMRFGIAVAIVATAVVLLCVFRRRVPAIVSAALVYGIMLLPVLGLMQNGPQLVADRYSYLPCIGWAVVGGGGLVWLWRKGWMTAGVGAIVIAFSTTVALGLLTWKQQTIWHDSTSLWTHLYEHDKNSPFAQNGYGYILLQQNKLDEAITCFREALDKQPTNDMANYNLWNALARLPNEPELLKALEQGAANANENVAVVALYRLGKLYLDRKENERAAAYYRRLVDLQPDHAEGRTNLGVALQRLNRAEDAMEQYQIVIQQHPSLFQPRYNLGMIYAASGRKDEAIKQLQIATQLNPEHQKAREKLAELVGSR